METTYDLDGMMPREMQGLRVPRMRAIRDQLLVASDWTVLPDSPLNVPAWVEYRQQLRDFPATWVPAPTVTFPNPPTD
jgi:hypothetical protein